MATLFPSNVDPSFEQSPEEQSSANMSLQKRNAAIINAYLQGIEIPALAVEFGRSASTIHHLLQANEVPLRKTRSVHLTSEQLQLLEADYQAGVPLSELLAKYQIRGHTAFYGVLADNNIPIRAHNSENMQARQLQLDTAVTLYQEGHTLAFIKSETNIHQPRLHAECAARGIPLRRVRTSQIK